MIIEKNKVVTLSFDLTIEHEKEGTVLVDRADDEHPFVYMHGTGSLPPKFETSVEGLKVGDHFDFQVLSEEAYGDFDEEAIIDLPKEVFMQDGEIDHEMLQVGNMLPLTDGNGHHMEGRVLEVNEATVKLDMNHPLAGQDLHFVGTVKSIREAEAAEIEHGHVHGPHGHHH